MALRLALNYENAKHRFLKTAEIILKLGGAEQPQAAGSQQGQHLWDLTVADGQQLVLTIRIPAPPNSGTSNLFLLTQPLKVAADGTGFRLNPDGADGHWKNFFNPRLTGQWVAAGAGQRFEINADLTFLDVTDYFQRFTHDPANAAKKNPGLDFYKKFEPLNPVDPRLNVRPPTPPKHYNVRLRLLEFTGGQAVTWGVVIPEKVTSASKLIHALMFFRPVSAELYTNTDDLNISDMVRYLTDPTTEDTPFYSRDPKAAAGVKWDPFPQCGWEGQIHKSGKCVVFVHPFPHKGAFGAAASEKFPALLNSLVVKALWADQTIATDVLTDLRLGKIGLSGFSRGGDSLYQALNSNPKKVDELYLFDPLRTANNQSQIISWFKLGGRKLRMMGGVYEFGTMLTIVNTLKSGDATVRPSSRAEWSGGASNMFPTAVVPIRGGKQHSLLLVSDTQTDALQREISDKSQIFFVKDVGNGSVEIEAALSTGKRVRRTISDCTRNEVAQSLNIGLDIAIKGKVLTAPKKDPVSGKLIPAGMIEFPGVSGPLFFKPDFIHKIPMKTEADVDHNVSVFVHFTKDVRHQWSVVGGDDLVLSNRGANFVGYLQAALTSSNFT